MMLKFVKRFSGLAIGSTVAFLGMVSFVPALTPWGNSKAIATAPMPPQLVPAVLGGKPVYILYMTRSGDRALVRCYPGQQPKLEVQTRTDGVKEGLLTCGS